MLGTSASPPSTAVVTGTVDADVEVAAPALEARVGQQVHPQVEVAGRRPAGAVFSFARHADPRAVVHASGDPHVHAACVAFVLDREAARRPVERVLERQFQVLLDVPAPLGPCPASLAGRPALGFRRAASEERMEEIREGILVAEDPPHLVFRHRPGSALAAADVDGPRAVAEGARPALLLRLLVLAPVRAEFVVLAPLLRVAEHLVGLVDRLEARLGVLSPGLTSGCVFRASLRYACLISFSVAVFATPSVA